jgi:cellulose synthase/poly-beta-1,6-N-acetylglucosamine synthase-like glycosyltransferase
VLETFHLALRLVGDVSHAVVIADLFAISAFGLAPLWLLMHHVRLKRTALREERELLASPMPPDAELPHVLVQIPSFNEGSLVRRIGETIAKLDWPRDKLHIQILDDSTDESALAAREAAAQLSGLGIDAILLHRTLRTGFKAGALAAGLAHSSCEFVAIFDVDYLPPPDFLRACMRPMLLEPRLGLVQARCDFLNGRENPLTAAQQRLLDAHFAVEQATRSWLRLLLPFNGTCGIWRRAAIEAAGGWQGDTLSEDMDLSYRMQSMGWTGRYLVTVTVPGELPSSLDTWRTQQFRWAKGFAQAARKLMPIVWRSSLPPRVKAATLVHLASSSMNSLLCGAFIAVPVDLMLGPGLTPIATALLWLAIAESVVGGIAQVLLGQSMARGADPLYELRNVPSVAWFGLRVAFSNARGIVEAFVGRSSAFVRTPKKAGGNHAIAAAREDR